MLSACSDLAGPWTDFWTGLFSGIGGSLEQKRRFDILMLFLEVLLLRIALAGLHDMNLDVQIALQAQYFVDLEVQIS